MRNAGTEPCRAIRWSVFGWIWRRAAASSVFSTRSKSAPGKSDARESRVGCIASPCCSRAIRCACGIPARLSARLNRFVWSFKEDVAIHTHRELIPCRNLDRGLNVQIASCDLGARLAEFLADGASSGLSWCWIRQSALAGSLRDLERGGEHAREHGESNNPAIVAVYLSRSPALPWESRPIMPSRSTEEASG